MVEALDDNLLFRWFLDFNLLDPVWDNSTFSKNQDRLLAHRVAEVFFARVLNLAREHGWARDAHFTVDGPLIESWASLKSFQPKAGAKDPRDGDPGNPSVDFHGRSRSNATHHSITDAAAQFARKGKGKEARLCFGLHALIAPRPFFVSGGSEDPASRWTALNHAVAVNTLLGFTNRVGFSQRAGHDPTKESNAQLYAFFERSLRSAGPPLRK